LQQFSPAIKDAVMRNPDVRKHVQDYFEEHNLNPSPEEQEAFAMQAVTQSVVETFVDTVVLMQRIRQDSNAFRDYVTGPEDVLRGVEQQLEVMNLAMASIPPMAAQMELMNINMASMTHSMGSTMGRMGKWMPW
jgi:molecular chaperone DnaK (HSP70)